MPPESRGMPLIAPPAAGRHCRLALRAAACVGLALVTAACSGLLSGQRAQAPPPVTRPTSETAAILGEYLQMLQKLVQGQPSEQAEILANAQRDYDIAPTPSHELKLALILGTPGHPATDLPRAQTMLRELMASPEMLLPAERALTFLELSQIDDHLTLETENRRLQAEALRADHERLANANHRLQAEIDENARLRRDLEDARAKLDAIAKIERSLNERKPGSTGR